MVDPVKAHGSQIPSPQVQHPTTATDAESSAIKVSGATGQPSTKIQGNTHSKSFIHKIITPLDKAIDWLQKTLIENLGSIVKKMKIMTPEQKTVFQAHVQVTQDEMAKAILEQKGTREYLFDQIKQNIEQKGISEEKRATLVELQHRLEHSEDLKKGHYDLLVDLLYGEDLKGEHRDILLANSQPIKLFEQLEKIKHKDVVSVENEYRFITPEKSKNLNGRWLLGTEDRKICKEKFKEIRTKNETLIRTLISDETKDCKREINEFNKKKEELLKKNMGLVPQSRVEHGGVKYDKNMIEKMQDNQKDIDLINRQIANREAVIKENSELEKMEIKDIVIQMARSPSLRSSLEYNNENVELRDMIKYAEMLYTNKKTTDSDYNSLIKPFKPTQETAPKQPASDVNIELDQF